MTLAYVQIKSKICALIRLIFPTRIRICVLQHGGVGKCTSTGQLHTYGGDE